MKIYPTLLAFSLIIPTAVAQDRSLESALALLNAIPGVAASAGTPAADCSHTESLQHGRDRITKDPNVPVLKCPPPTTSEPIPRADLNQFIRDFNVGFAPASERDSIIASDEFQKFVHEARKFPANLLRQMAEKGAKITLIRGRGVTADPAWEQERLRQIQAINNDSSLSPEDKNQRIAAVNLGYSETVEGGRSWAYTSGSGGNFSVPTWNVPTRIVINHMYSTDFPLPDGRIETREEGSVNLFLHEHGHALDNFHGPGTISNTEEWRTLRANNAAYFEKIFTTYEFNQLNEGFAEAFAYYFGCPTSRAQMTAQAPEVAAFFERLRARDMTP